MSIRASLHGDNARRRSNTPFLAFLRNRESRNQLLYACVQAVALIALVLGLVIAGADLRDAEVLASAPTAAPVVVSAAVP
ncbi:MAG TPA: hypothetical protein VK047_10120 [Zeimonas sp.]|nr:hypothetical protein [Zeimonas sp.]